MIYDDEYPHPFHSMISTLTAKGSSSGMNYDERHDNFLYASSVNYFSLATFGRVKLEWLDDISSHLVFDRQKRKLSVFRFPSYCAAAILGGGQFRSLER